MSSEAHSGSFSPLKSSGHITRPLLTRSTAALIRSAKPSVRLLWNQPDRAGSPNFEVGCRTRTRGSVIAEMTQLAARTGLLWDPGKMASAVRAREDMHSTALDNGVALLHPRRPMPAILAEAILALGVAPRGIPFGGGGSLTNIFFLICSTTDHEHLRILARLSRIINDHEVLAAMRAAETAGALHRLIADREAVIRASS